MKPSVRKVTAIQRIAIVRDVKGRLLGTLNYYRHFISDMPHYLVSLKNFLKKGQKVILTPVYQLRPYMFWRSFRIHTDLKPFQ